MSQRRKFTAAFKAQVVLEVLTGVKTAAQVCREHGVKDSLLCRWKQEFLERAPRLFEEGKAHDPCQARIAELERMVGRLTMELADRKKSIAALDLSTERKRELSKMLMGQGQYAVTDVCAVVDLPRSSYYHERRDGDHREVRAAIEAIAREFPTYGSRRVTAQLRRAPPRLVVNRKRVQRLMRQMGLSRLVRPRKWRTTDSRHAHRRYPNLVAGLTVTYPDQVWVSDITYIRLGRGYVYLAVIMDVYTRAIRGWGLSPWLDQDLTLAPLRRALGTGRAPTIHHSDQGVQYASSAYVELLTKHHVQISMAAPGKPEENGHAERVIRTIKEEEVELSEYVDFADAVAQIGHFIEEVYQKKRIHSALGYLTPVEFEAVWRESQREVVTSLIGGQNLSNFRGPLPSPSPCPPLRVGKKQSWRSLYPSISPGPSAPPS